MSNTDLLTGNPVDPPSALNADPDIAQEASKRGPGRPRGQTRGRPASRAHAAPMPAARSADTMNDPTIEPDYVDYEALAGTLTRQTRVNGDNTFDIPLKGQMPGWDYQFWPFQIMGQDVDASEQVNYQMGGWIPVKPSMFPSLCPPGWKGATIDRQGQRLFMRPQRLTDEAIAEQQAQAFERKQAALQRAAAGESGTQYAPRRNDGLSVQVRPLLE